ncbi:hypothetical protein AruPA_20605 [Acidiphilium sp. PA]|uniref:hypothetical protein n=1 Tax=Acidiphilium sp. PA TaxID=2871705 RepID=UPI002244E93D|nr:hypothetical protein [Acidiphilium sp. PA]MCW8309420.1 hypothetical protein [Acidiphilium sp. PA]
MKSSPPSETLTVVAGSGQARSTIAVLSNAFSRLFVMGRRPVLLRDLDSWCRATLKAEIFLVTRLCVI